MVFLSKVFLNTEHAIYADHVICYIILVLFVIP